MSDSQIVRAESTLTKRRRTEDLISDSVYHLNGACCPPECTGLQCTKIREMASNVTYELETHEHLVHGSAIKDKFKESDQVVPIVEVIREIANRLHHSNTELRKLLESNVMAGILSKPPPSSSLPVQASIERRASVPSWLESSTVSLLHQEQQEPHIRNDHRSLKSSQSFQPLLAQQHGAQPPVLAPVHAPPSPISLQTSLPPAFPSSMSLSSSRSPPLLGTTLPSTTNSNSAQAVHLKDLQHQLAVKTLSHNSLLSEYSTLLKVLERQRVKCTTLERKFHVSDAEIVALANEKERLEQAIEGMEKQMRELRKSRDDARKQGADAAAQYLRIVQMAGKLHSGEAGGPEDEPGLLDRDALLKRVEALEVQLMGSRRSSISAAGTDKISLYLPDKSHGEEKLHVDRLEEEVKRLRIRNTKLENGFIAAKQAVMTLAAHGQNVGTVLNKALEES